MPTYSFLCEDCTNAFEINCFISDYDGVVKGMECPSCSSKNVYRDYSTDKVSGQIKVQTLGMMAQKNSERMTDEQKAALNFEHKKYLYEEGNELPAGMKRARKPINDKYLPVPNSPKRKKRELKKCRVRKT